MMRLMPASIEPYRTEAIMQRLSALQAEAASSESDERRALLNDRIKLVNELLEIAKSQQSVSSTGVRATCLKYGKASISNF
jgi:hypothetical protein